jgi:hypothetical protein
LVQGDKPHPFVALHRIKLIKSIIINDNGV